MKSFLLSCFFTLLVCESIAQTDTIHVRADSICGNFMPSRMHYVMTSKTGSGGYEYTDSVRVCDSALSVYNLNYYLIVYDKNGAKRLEGYFYDQFAVGHCINYDWKGRKTSEGDYKIKGKGKRKYSAFTGVWKYYNANGDIIRTEKH